MLLFIERRFYELQIGKWKGETSAAAADKTYIDALL